MQSKKTFLTKNEQTVSNKLLQKVKRCFGYLYCISHINNNLYVLVEII